MTGDFPVVYIPFNPPPPKRNSRMDYERQDGGYSMDGLDLSLLIATPKSGR
jgi:hypothetical protein